jgi:hypothetical protein
MVITSLNLYDYSEQKNREYGVFLSRQEDIEAFNEALAETKRIIEYIKLSTNKKSGDIINVVKSERQKLQSLNKQHKESDSKGFWNKNLSEMLSGFFANISGIHTGYCIGCGKKSDYDIKKPYCPDCFSEWAKNKQQKAKYCHECGRKSITSTNKPLCRACYSNSRVTT